MEMPEVPHQKNGMCLGKNKADHQFRVILYIYIYIKKNSIKYFVHT